MERGATGALRVLIGGDQSVGWRSTVGSSEAVVAAHRVPGDAEAPLLRAV